MDNHIEAEQFEKKDKGFTLVELLIVIVILGILATVTVFAVRGITTQGQTSACDADQKTLEVAAEAYFAQKGGATIPLASAGDVTAQAALIPPVTITQSAEGTLVVAGLMRGESPLFELNTNGGIVAVTGGKCDV